MKCSAGQIQRTRTEDISNLNYPGIAVCMKSPYKNAKLMTNVELLKNNTYAMDDIFNEDAFQPTLKSGLVTVLPLQGRDLTVMLDM